MPNPTQLDHLEELLAKAHPLPWENHPVKGYSHDEVFTRDAKGEILCICADGDADYRDAPLIVGAINTLPSLIADLRAMREALEDIAEHATVRRQDGIELGATVWRIALEDIVRDARRALAKEENNHD